MFSKIILASQSPRRKQLLQWAEVPFEIIVKETAENFPANLSVKEVAIYIAMKKAKAVKEFLLNEDHPSKHLPILAADTIVVINNEIIGKPKDREDAIKILQSLSGRKHEVITGVVIFFEEKEIAFADITEVIFHEITDQQIKFYVDNYKPYDKAGAYAIQEWIGVIGIKSINGDFYNVMGLPVSKVVKVLAQLNN